MDTLKVTPSQSALSALPDSGKELYSKAADYLLEIDGQIARLDKVLARLQPPVSGRMRISWRDEGSSATAKCKPVLVRWVRVGDKWRTTRLGLKSLVQKTPKSGAFYDTKDEVKETVRELSWLLNRRAKLVDSINALEKAVLYSCDRNQDALASLEQRIESLENRAAMLPCTWRDGQQVGEGTKETLVADLTDEEAQALFDSL